MVAKVGWGEGCEGLAGTNVSTFANNGVFLGGGESRAVEKHMRYGFSK